MTRTRINSLLYAGSAALGAAAVAVVLAASLLPLDVAARTDLTAPVPPKPTSSLASNDAIDRATLASLEPILSRPLRGKPASAAAPAVPVTRAVPPPAAAPGMTLVGTIGDTTAMIRTPDGSIVARSVGQRVGGSEVVSVGGGEVKLRLPDGRVQVLRKLSNGAVNP